MDCNWDAGLRKLTLLRMDAIAIGVLVAANARRTISITGPHIPLAVPSAIDRRLRRNSRLVPQRTTATDHLLGAVTGSLTLSLLASGGVAAARRRSASPPKASRSFRCRIAVSRTCGHALIYLTTFRFCCCLTAMVPSMRSQNPARHSQRLLASGRSPPSSQQRRLHPD